MKKRLKVSLLAIIITLLTSNLALAEVTVIDYPPGETMPVDNISMNTNLDDSFYDLTYCISSTGATSGIRYRTNALTIFIGGYKAIIDFSSFRKAPGAGTSSFSQITIGKQDLIAAIGVAHEADINELLKAPEINVSVGAIIQIYNAGTGAILATINEKNEVASKAGAIGFGQKDISDMETRWKSGIKTTPRKPDPFEDPDPTTEIESDPTPPSSNSGLRPSILVP